MHICGPALDMEVEVYATVAANKPVYSNELRISETNLVMRKEKILSAELPSVL
jgi:hypothetical protein